MAELLRLLPPEKPLEGATWHLPPSKSIANRALVLAAQQPQPVEVTPHATADDVQAVLHFMASANRLTPTSTGYRVQASASELGEITVEVGLAGSAARFLAALCTLLPGRFRLQGAPRLHERPIAPLVVALQAAGASVQYAETEGHLPLLIDGRPVCLRSPLKLVAGSSSQFLSAVLLLGPSLPEGFEVWLEGPVASESYVQLTLSVCQAFGIQWQATTAGFVLATQTTTVQSFFIEPDWSNASYAVGCGVLGGYAVRLPGLSMASAQGDAAQVKVWEAWGVEFRQQELLLADTAQARILAFDYDFSAMPDLAQTFAVLATQAMGPCTLRGLHTLRLKETDRIAALVSELSAMGIQAHAEGDVLTVVPGSPSQTRPLHTYHDHRMAMAFAPLCHVLPGGLWVDDPAVVSKSFPTFWEQLRTNGYRLHSV